MQAAKKSKKSNFLPFGAVTGAMAISESLSLEFEDSEDEVEISEPVPSSDSMLLNLNFSMAAFTSKSFFAFSRL